MTGSSQLMTSVRLNDLYSASIQRQSQEAQTANYNDSVSYSSSIMDATTKAINLAKTTGNTLSNGTHYQYGENAAIANSLNQQQAISKKLMEEYGVNEEQSVQLIAAANSGLHKEIGGSGLPVNAIDLALSAFKVKGNIGGSLEGKALSVATAQEAVKRAQDLMISENATYAIDDIVRAAQDGHFNIGSDKQGRLSEDFRSSLDEMYRQENNYNLSLQKLEGLQKMSSFLKSSNLNIDQNLQQYTFEKIANLENETGNRLGETEADRILKDPLLAKNYIDQIVATDLKTLEDQYKNTALSSDQINTNYHTNNSYDTTQIKDNYNNNKAQIIEDANNIGVNTYNNTVVANTTQESATKLLKQNQNYINSQSSITENSNNQFRDRIDQKLNLHSKGLFTRSLLNSGKRLVNADDKK